MPISQPPYNGFTKIYDRPVSKLTTYVDILPVFSEVKSLCHVPIKLKALWDTGATITAVKHYTLNRLKAPLVRTKASAKIVGIGGMSVEANYILTNIHITEDFYIQHCPTYIMDFPSDFDMIIGMDIIGMGDFAVCNTDCTTSFSFVVPSLPDRIDFIEKIETLNRRTG